MFHISGMNISGPVSAAGAADVISGDAGFWRATFGSVVVTTRNRVLAFNGIAAKLQGRLYPILVPYCHAYQPIDPDAVLTEVPHSDDSFFDDDTGYVGSGTHVTITTDLIERSVAGTVDIAFGDMLQPGQVFSFDEHMYRLDSVVYTSDTTAALRWQPPLRAAVTAGDELEFTRPVCRMRLATDDEMMLSLDANRRGFPTVNFVEDLVS
jgi:hypothetical protein